MNSYIREFDYLYKDLLDLVNTPFGRSQLKIQSKDRIVKISPNSYHILKGFKNGKPQLEATFFTSDRVAEKLLPIVSANKFYRYAYATGTFTSDTGEGEVDTGNHVAWADARNDTSGSVAATIRPYASTGYDIIRTFFPIDTSSLTSAAEITAGGNSFKLYRDDAVLAFFNADTASFHVIQTTQASPTSLAATDLDNITFTSGGTFTLGSTSNGAYSTATFNTTGDGWISKTGHTLLGGIIDRDLNDSQPTGLNGFGAQNRGGANPPTLTVTYTLPSGGYFFMSV